MILTAIEAAVGSWLVPSLFGLIAFFLYRILGQFDTLNKTVVQLNTTMLKIDKDLTSEISTLKAVQMRHGDEIRNFTTIYDRVRETENNVTFLQAKCEEYTGVKGH